MNTPSNAAPVTSDTSMPPSVSRRVLAVLIGSVALSHAAPGDAKKKFGKRHPHRPGCANIGESETGMRKRKGRKARPGRVCCEGLVVDPAGVCAAPPTI